MHKNRILVILTFIFAIVGVLFSVINLEYKFKVDYSKVDFTFSIIIFIGAVYLTVIFLYILLKNIKRNLVYGKIIFQFSKLCSKRDFIFLILFAIITILKFIGFIHEPKLSAFLLVYFFLIMTLFYFSIVYDKDGIREGGIESFSWNEIEYFELDRGNKTIKYKSKGQTRIVSHKILNSDWNNTIEDFLNQNIKILDKR